MAGRCGASLGASSTTAHVHVADLPACARHSATTGPAAPCCRPRPRLGRVGEVVAQVAEAGRAEQGVGDGVGDHVGVAVAGQAAVPRGDTPPRTSAPSRLVAERMDVEAQPDPRWASRRDRPQASSTASHDQVARAGHLEVVGRSPATTTTRPPAASTRAASSVASAAAGVGARESAGPERLGGLHGHQAGPVEGVDRPGRRRPA